MTTMTEVRTTQVYQVFIMASPEAIWEAITKPEFTAKYFHGSVIESTYEPGTSYNGYSPDHSVHFVDGEVVEAAPPTRLVTTWRALWEPELAAEPHGRVTWEVEPQDGGVSLLTVVHDGLAESPKTAEVVGAPMGWSYVLSGLKTLLLLGQHPKLLAGAVAIDPVTNFLLRYDDFALSPSTRPLQVLARLEVGGTPKTNAEGYILRSPSHWVAQIAASGVPLQLWWSTADLIVKDQIHQTAHFYQELEDLKPKGRLDAVTGTWAHSVTMRQTQLPAAMRWLGLLGGPDV